MKTVFRFVLIMITTISVFVSCKTLSFTEKTILAEIPVQYYSKSIVLVDAGEVYTPGLAITKKEKK